MIKAEDNITLVSNKATHDIASDTAQFFWVEETGTDTGVHITEVTKEAFLANPSGGNLLARSNGLAVRDGLTELASFSADGIHLGEDDVVEISPTGATPTVVRVSYDYPDSIDFSTGDAVELDLAEAQFLKQLQTGAYFTVEWTQGQYTVSVTLRKGVSMSSTTSGFNVAYDGETTFTITPTAPMSAWADTRAQCYMQYTTKGAYFALGKRSGSVGRFSGSFGEGLIASGGNQLVIGSYNEEDTDKAFIIGNGSLSNNQENRSNAFAIDWQGKIDSLYKITQVTKVLTGGINANSYIQATNIAMTSVDGYNAVGIVGHSSSNFRVQPTSEYVASNSAIFAGFANWSASNVTSDVTVIFYVLWLKATQA